MKSHIVGNRIKLRFTLKERLLILIGARIIVVSNIRFKQWPGPHASKPEDQATRLQLPGWLAWLQVKLYFLKRKFRRKKTVTVEKKLATGDSGKTKLVQ